MGGAASGLVEVHLGEVAVDGLGEEVALYGRERCGGGVAMGCFF